MSQEPASAERDPAAAIVARLVADAAARPEHRLLDALIGEWDTRSEWQLHGDGPWSRQRGRAENRWILDGRAVESRGVDADGTEVSRTLLAFDPTSDDFVAFAASIFSTSFQLERGPFDDLGPALVLEGHEVVPTMRAPLRYHRTITFVDPDRHAIAISYPDHPDGRFGSLFVEHRRAGP